jgi:hypothetical protein
MGIERLKFSEAVQFAVAVAIGRINPPPHNTHAGVIYKDRDGLRMIHLGWHHQLHDSEWRFGQNYAYVVPEVPPERANAVAALCRLIRRKQPGIPYAFRLVEDVRFEMTTGDIVLSKGASGLNCSSFVLIVFLQAGIRLIQLETWEERPEDREWQQYLLDLLIRTSAPSGHVEAVRTEIGCARVRPEEVAGACLEQDLPASFARCRDNGRAILNFLDHGVARSRSGAAG